jgi:8-oxo-dGTP pyrophosphatase MutT (NUDIX family)
VIGTDAHLPPVDSDRLRPAALRDAFARRGDWQPALAGDGRILGGRAQAAAAVLVALIEREQGLRVLLTRRTAHLRDHAGQISFPGGRVEAHDADVAAAALRETQEEVGVHADSVDVIGQLPPYATITNFVVTPVVGLVSAPPVLRLDTFEVDEAFEVPLDYLMTPAHHQRHRFEFEGQSRQFLSMPWRGPGADGVVREYFIWGATAAMLRNLYHFLSR